MNQTATIIHRHVNNYVSVDGCLVHGIGIGVCRVCLKNSKTGDLQAGARHIAGYDVHGYYVSEGFPRMSRP